MPINIPEERNYIVTVEEHYSILKVVVECYSCTKHSKLYLPTADFNAWLKGTLIQDAFPNMTNEGRCTLSSGLCIECQKRMELSQ